MVLKGRMSTHYMAETSFTSPTFAPFPITLFQKLLPATVYYASFIHAPLSRDLPQPNLRKADLSYWGMLPKLSDLGGRGGQHSFTMRSRTKHQRLNMFPSPRPRAKTMSKSIRLVKVSQDVDKCSRKKPIVFWRCVGSPGSWEA